MPLPPSLLSALVFHAKASALRVRRTLRDARRPVARHGQGERLPRKLAEVRAPLYDGREPEMELGKAQNLRLVARRLDGVRVPAGETFSFWRQVGPCRRRRGYVRGREIRQGCVVPSVGGGVCGLTNGLYEAALRAGLEVLERHPHSRIVPGSAAERGMDATVAWNYLDLRLRAPFEWAISVELTRDEIVVSIRSGPPLPSGGEGPGVRGSQFSISDFGLPNPISKVGNPKSTLPLRVLPPAPGDCADCGRTECFRHAHRPHMIRSRTAYWVDEVSPEFAAYVMERAEGDLLLAPMRMRAAYAWEATDATAWSVALVHALRARRLVDQGAARQAALLARAAALARRYAQMTPFDADEIVLPIGLLPFAWREGALGGRRFRVLAGRLPFAEIHRRLDAAVARFPDRALLGDFRAPEALVEAERAALREADAVVTPHPEIAALFGTRAVLLPWAVPSGAVWAPGPALGFPGPVVGRKGAYEVREAARRLGLTVVTPGRDVEGEGFWGDVPVRRGSPLDGTFAVAQPALLEDRPRALLRAVAAGCPVVATRACGVAGATEVPPLDADALTEALRGLMSS